jgi:hypothetical protein
MAYLARILCLPALLFWLDGAVGQTNNFVFEAEPARHALVIGNASYKHLPRLESAATDAGKMAEILQAAGFRVTQGTMASVAQFEDELLPAFRKNIAPGDIALVYFSGHGFSFGPHNYVAALDMPASVREQDLGNVAVALETLEYTLSRRHPALTLFLVDACRSIPGLTVPNPSVPGTVVKGPTAPPPPPPQTESNYMIGFAARPGSTALAFTVAGVPSPFTFGLLRNIAREGTSFKSSFTDVIADVYVKTSKVQQPGLVDYAATDFFFRPTPTILGQEKELWLSVLETRDREEILRFSVRHAASRYARAAREWLRTNESSPLPVASEVSPIAVERSWETPNVVKTVEPASSGLAFASTQSAEALVARSLPDELLGVASSTGVLSNAIGKLQRDLQSYVAHGSAVTTAAYIARETPSQTSPGIKEIGPGTRLQILGQVPSEAPGTWIAARVPGVAREKIYFSAPSAPPSDRLVKLGRAVAEIVAAPRPTGITDLVDAASIAGTVNGLRSNNTSITWVSLAIAQTDDAVEAGARKARLANARYVLRQLGVPAERITAVSNATDFQGRGVRVRIFGR